ncbi:hypothetical protein [Flavobacterium soyae]|uniref:hypothetical protein n=1 Tax=Flavobacterium soyae TaxID=2903098 RepID=UPI001E5BCD20|nr:hypothetical protein [Flavobacterium soyae]MCD9576641.1 hypothetical protein [Flavobacterium soyae]
MKQFFLTILILLFTISNYAQKIKIDKGEIKLDEKPVAYIEGKKPSFKVSSLDKNYKMSIQLKQILPVPAIPIMELTNEETTKSNEIEFTKGKFNPFNNEKSVVTALIEHNYLNVDGLNIDAIENFINGEATGIAAKLIEAKNEIDQANKAIDAYQLSIDDAGTIYSIKAQNPDPADKRIGYIRVILPSKNGELNYEVLDLDNYLMATWFAKSGTFPGYKGFLNEELVTYDKKIFKVAFDNHGNPMGYKMSKDITAMNIVRVLVGNGYKLQHQGKAEVMAIRVEQAKITEEKIKTERSNSANIYEQNGYVINEKGEKKIWANYSRISIEKSGIIKRNG